MGRIEQLLGPIGIVVAVILVLAALMRFSVTSSRRRQSDSDNSLDGGMTDREFEADPSTPSEYADFAALMDRFVLPLAKAHPGWERLDGAYGIPGRPVAWFLWNGTRYSLNGETHFASLLKAHTWIKENPSIDPLVVQKTTRGAGRLTLRPEIGLENLKAIRIETG
jgi:hypothetical protein